jgi:pilus assembly protein TadC
MYFNRNYKIAVYGISFIVFIVSIFLMVMNRIYVITPPYYIPLTQRVNNSIGFGLIIAFLFPALVEYNNSLWLKSVEKNTPRLLLDVTETVRSGVPLIEALKDASTRDYGPVSQELSTAMMRFGLTSDFSDALQYLNEALIRPIIKRMNILLQEAYQMGGQAINVLDTSVDLFTNITEHREQRKSRMRPYVSIVYAGSIIFLIISFVILTKFIVPINNISSDLSMVYAPSYFGPDDIHFFKSILFWAASIQAIFGGLVAGKISTARLSGGLIHVVVLLLTTILFFNMFNV